MATYIANIEFYLPEKVLTNEEIAATAPKETNWTADKIFEKTGIKQRHIASETECASDLAVKAAEKLLAYVDRTLIDYVIYCTQSPDYYLPSGACIIQDRLGLSTKCGALDINLGCSGYVYGLGLAKGLIDSGQAKHILFLTADTYTKYINPRDSSVRTLFGDAGTATLLCSDGVLELSNHFVYGTDGKGKDNLIVKNGANRCPYEPEPRGYNIYCDENNLFMNGPEIFSFTSKAVPKLVNEMLDRSAMNKEGIDLFIFHQANSFMLKHLQRMMKIPDEKFFIDMEDCGNTVSSTIPIALKKFMMSGDAFNGMNIMLVGFGVGYSWGATNVKWKS